MKLFKTGVDLKENLVEFIENSTNLFIYVPYIKLDTLKELLKNTDNCKAIFVRWETKDLITGACDLEIYLYCKQNGISLYRNKRIHLKAYVEDYKRSFIGSPNISVRGLNMPENNFYNYELATIVEEMDIEDRLYFSTIESESILITDNIYKQISEQLPEKRKKYPDEEDFVLKIMAPDKDFLIYSLPLTYSVETLCRIYENRTSTNDVELNCATHDLALYKIPFGLSLDVFNSRLEFEFFNHPFIKLFLDHLNVKGEMYFGEVKMFIHNSCSDAPLPRRWEITENIQILYRWIVKLGNGRYAIDKPNHSERLFVTNR